MLQTLSCFLSFDVLFKIYMATLLPLFTMAASCGLIVLKHCLENWNDCKIRLYEFFCVKIEVVHSFYVIIKESCLCTIADAFCVLSF